jgi:hypothetical protein
MRAVLASALNAKKISDQGIRGAALAVMSRPRPGVSSSLARVRGGVRARPTELEVVRCNGLGDPKLRRRLPKAALAKLREEVEMAKGLCPPFDPKAHR